MFVYSYLFLPFLLAKKRVHFSHCTVWTLKFELLNIINETDNINHLSFCFDIYTLRDAHKDFFQPIQ